MHTEFLPATILFVDTILRWLRLRRRFLSANSF